MATERGSQWRKPEQWIFPQKSPNLKGERSKEGSHALSQNFQESLYTVFREPLSETFHSITLQRETTLANQTTHYNVKKDFKSRKKTPTENEKPIFSP